MVELELLPVLHNLERNHETDNHYLQNDFALSLALAPPTEQAFSDLRGQNLGGTTGGFGLGFQTLAGWDLHLAG